MCNSEELRNINQTNFRVEKVLSTRSSVAILTCHYNQLSYLEAFIESLRRTNFQRVGSYVVVIIDQGSTDGSREYLENLVRNTDRGELPLIVQFWKENKGFGEGMNRAYEAARCYYPEFFVFVNNDVVFEQSEWLERMLITARGGRDRGAIGPIANSGGAKIRQERGNSFVESTQNDYQIGTLSGYCFMLDSSVASYRFASQGWIFDPIFSLGYYEDSDLFEWIQEKNCELWVSRGAYVYHKGRRTTQAILPGRRQELLSKNKQIYLERWGRQPCALRLGKKRR